MSYPGNPQDPYAQPGAQPPGYPPGGYPSGGFQQPGYPSGGFQQPGYPSGGFQQPGYPQQPPPAPGAYGQYPPPQYAAGYPGYGQPAKSGRPGLVTAAAVLAFVFGGLGIMSSLVLLAAGGLVSAASNACQSTAYLDSDTRLNCDAVSGVGTVFTVVSIGLIVVAALMIAGGVTAITGKNGQILVIACAVYAVLVVVLIVSSAFWFGYVFGIVLPVLIVVFMLNSQSRGWFRSVGGRTF